MKDFRIKIWILLICCVSCVKPNEIPLGGNSDWVVFGLMGENEPPIIFIYGVQIAENRLIYKYDAEITVIDQETNQRFVLHPVINENLEQIGSNEFPFGEDILGNVVYYSSDLFKPLKGTNYKVEFNLGEEQGIANIILPEKGSFSSVEIDVDNDNVSKLKMSISDFDTVQNYYKWEVRIDQTLQLQYFTIDSISGDTIYDIYSQDVKGQFIPNNYITKERIEEENLFKFNLSANLTNYPENDETYLLNVRLRHYGKEVVDYFESIEDQSNGSLYDPFIEPVFIKSNIEGLIGLLGTYSYSETIWIEYQP